MKRCFSILILVGLILLTAPHALAAESFPARAVGVVDGDTLRVMRTEGGTIKVRLFGIDCPEKGQRHGKKARGLTHRLSNGRVVLIESHGKGRYGRTIGDVILPGGKNLNHALVKAGACWWYRRYAPKDETLKRLEAEARKAKRGLWANPKPVPPWKWRKQSRSLGKESWLEMAIRGQKVSIQATIWEMLVNKFRK